MVITSKKLGIIFILPSFIPLGFFCYTLLNLNTLKIAWIHPRVIVEALFCIILLSIGLYSYQKKERK
jgi:hypothetical protein